jgi:hypothetical protein
MISASNMICYGAFPLYELPKMVRPSSKARPIWDGLLLLPENFDSGSSPRDRQLRRF